MREKVFITAVLVLCWALLPMVGYGGDGTNEASVATGMVWRHFVYMWCHGNVWHLIGNVFVVWLLRNPLYLLPAIVIGFLCSWIPAVPGLWEMIPAAGTVAGQVMTVGFSGVLFAIVGVKWGRWIRSQGSASAYGEFGKKVVPIALLGFFIPHFNWSLHLYCLIAGLGYGIAATMWQHRKTCWQHRETGRTSK